MPIATPEKYAEMLDAAKSQGFAFPAINVSSSQTLGIGEGTVKSHTSRGLTALEKALAHATGD